MADATVEAAVQAISSALLKRPKKEITGALLGELITKLVPSLSIRDVVGIRTGPGALSKFISDYLSHVLSRDRNQGADWVYSIKGDGVSLNSQSNDEALWTAFVRPDSGYSLFIRDNTLLVDRSSFIESAGEQSGLCVNGLTIDDLDKMREEFIDIQVNEKGISSEELPSVSLSYMQWWEGIRKLGPELSRSWAEFRLKKIFEIFERRLMDVGVSSKQKDCFVEVLRRAQIAARVSRESRRVVNMEDAPIHSGQFEEKDLRAVVCAAVMKMSIPDLREIKIPVGLIFDELTKIKFR